MPFVMKVLIKLCGYGGLFMVLTLLRAFQSVWSFIVTMLLLWISLRTIEVMPLQNTLMSNISLLERRYMGITPA